MRLFRKAEIFKRYCAPIIGAILFVFTIGAVANDESPSLILTVNPAKKTFAPGDTVIVALRVEIPSGYHLYGNPLGPGIGKPLTIAIRSSGSVAWLDIVKTFPAKYKPDIGDWVWSYEKEAMFFLRGTAGRAGEIHDTIVFDGLICHTSCFPRHYEIPLRLRIDPKSPSEPLFTNNNKILGIYTAASEVMPFSRTTAPLSALKGLSPLEGISLVKPPQAQRIPAWHFSPRESGAGSTLNLFLAILFGFIAGIILNAMPCVLPVLGIKILSLTQGHQRGRGNAVAHSLAFSAGVLAVFMALAALTVFAGYSWGRHFQDPKALIAIIALIVVFALGLFDIYLLTIPSVVGNLENKKDHAVLGDFFKGIFATILATPCSGPFLGAVLAWAVTQKPFFVFIVYGSIAAGMSFPYVILSSSERLSRFVPKPGRWMQDFKALLGFVLLGFAVYLMLGLPDDYVIPTLLFCLAVALAVALFGRFAPWGSGFRRTVFSLLAALAIAGGGLYGSFAVVYPAFSSVKATCVGETCTVWRDFSADTLASAMKNGQPVILDFTANWCMNCQYNYLVVLSKSEVTDLIKKKNALALKVDMTMPDPVQDSLLHSLGSRSIPFLAIIPGDRPNEPVIMRDLLTKGKVVREIERLKP
jgi:thiol:disulfide interchange protein